MNRPVIRNHVGTRAGGGGLRLREYLVACKRPWRGHDQAGWKAATAFASITATPRIAAVNRVLESRPLKRWGLVAAVAAAATLVVGCASAVPDGKLKALRDVERSGYVLLLSYNWAPPRPRIQAGAGDAGPADWVQTPWLPQDLRWSLDGVTWAGSASNGLGVWTRGLAEPRIQLFLRGEGWLLDLAPSGSRIAYCEVRNSEAWVIVIGLDGNEVFRRQLPSEGGALLSGRINSAGTAVAIELGGEQQNSILVYDTAKVDPSILRGEVPSWCRHCGNLIYFAPDRGEFTCDAPGAHRGIKGYRPVTGLAIDPTGSWGAYVAYTAPSGGLPGGLVHLVELRTGEAYALEQTMPFGTFSRMRDFELGWLERPADGAPR